MKVSLSWIFDHIDADWKQQDVKEVISKFNYVTAEIEDFSRVNVETKNLFAARVLSHNEKKVECVIPELEKKVTLPVRLKTKFVEKKDIFGLVFLVCKEESGFRWATCKDVDLDKDGLLPAFDLNENDQKGSWRNAFESEDVILDVDNKSLTHRPDMWGHRGFAREIAAFQKLPLSDKGRFLEKHPIKNFDSKSKRGKKGDCVIEIKAKAACSRFSGLSFDFIENRPSNIFIASRLIKVGIRPINAIVDLTNYVMLDWSQPVHAYDLEKISKNTLVARMANKGEKLTLLDGHELELIPQDLVIADGDKAVGLAGIMGGFSDSIGEKTKAIFFESAHFDPVHIRRTSLRHGVRTDASARFEKTLDPNQITDAILRFMNLCMQTGVEIKVASEIVCVGNPFEEKTIGVKHSFLEKRIGVPIDRSLVVDFLTRLGFMLEETEEKLGDEDDLLYTIKIPSYRGAKDVETKEDILEEVVRSFGFNEIPLTLPELAKTPGDVGPILKMRKVKNFLAYSAQMTEQRNYLYYDEAFLSETGLTFDDALEIKNPVSENNFRLATSLLPNLFKNVKQNWVNENSLRFFEAGVVVSAKKSSEEESLAGIFFEKRKKFDFYEGKMFLTELFRLCGIEDSLWKKVESGDHPWVMPYQSAEIFVGDKKLGIAGKVDGAFLARLGALPESEAFFFEISMSALLSHKKDSVVYKPISKFQEITFDLCFMIPLTVTVSELKKILFEGNKLIERVELIDFFDKADWVDKRSVAFRLWVVDSEKTLEKEEIDSIRNSSIKVAKSVGAELR